MFWLLAFFRIIAIAEANPDLGTFFGSILGAISSDQCSVKNTTNTDAIICGAKSKSCSDSPYRSYDGTCNNLQNGWWGMANGPYKRLFESNYGDGVHAFPRSVKNKELPNCREISLKVYSTKQKDDPIWTIGFMQYGQIIAHDLSLTGGVGQTNTVIECCSNGKYTDRNKTDPRCDPIKIPKDDPVNKGKDCINFYRTETTQDRDDCKHTTKVAQQITSVTSYMDASYLYGNNEKTAKSVREGKCGKLKSVTRNGYELLPQDPNPTVVCAVDKNTDPCYLSGDVRVNQNPELALLQNTYMINHNYIAGKLCKLNPQWDDETLFEETRRIVIAIHQNIFYYEELQFLIGQKLASDKKLVYNGAPGYINDYDPSVNAATSNEYSTSAFRFFHTAIQGTLKAYNGTQTEGGSINIVKWFDNPSVIEYKNNYQGFIRGLATQPQNNEDSCIVREVRDYLFGDQDLKAIDCQRGRDHGLPSYKQAVEACCLGKINSFEDYEKFIDKESVKKLKSLYDSYEDVEMTAGISLETRLPLALCGPVAACLISEQLYRTRVGDRYFFENKQNPCPFTLDQLKAIRKIKFASLLCQVPGVEFIQPKAFILPTLVNAPISCKLIPQLDLSLWKTDSKKGCAK